MLLIFLCCCALFLLWAFFLAIVSDALLRLGQMLSLAAFEKVPFYLRFHRLLFRKRSFELLSFSASQGETVASVGYGASSLLALIRLSVEGVATSGLALLLYGLLFLFIMLFFGNFLPHFLTLRSPEKALKTSLPIASIFLYLTFPFSFLFMLVTRSERRPSSKDPFEEMKETVVQILKSAQVSGRLGSADKTLLASVLKFKDRIVREVMVPRVDLFSLSASTTMREAAKVLVEEGYSRVPVYRESIDDIVGVLMFKDILELYMDCEAGKKEQSLLDTPVETIAKNVVYTPETKKVAQLLQEFRTKQVHMAIVVDEYGGTEGVVTLEDILEEIVGEIADEYDIDEEMLYTAQPGGGSFLVDARMSIFDAEEIFNIHIPQEGEYDTIGGYIFHKVGAIPAQGLKIHHEDFDLEILSSTERSVERVRITPRRSDSD